MTREQAKREIDSLDYYLQNHTDDYSEESHTAMMMAISALSEIKRNWIPVSERLPLLRGLHKISDDVLITNGFEIDMGYLVERKEKIFWHYYGSEYEVGIKDEDNDATAWMPLPEAYKAEKPETCKGCLEPCIMYEPDMRACKKKVREVSE